MSDEEIEITSKYTRKRRKKQAKMQRQVRRSRRRLNKLRSMYKTSVILLLIFLCVFIIKMPQWRLHKGAFDRLDSQSLEIVNNHIVPSQKILSALRRTQVPLQPIFLVKTDFIKESVQILDPIQNVYIREI